CAEPSHPEARMIDNLRDLKDRRNELAGQNGANDGARRELVAALDRNGCHSENFYAPSDRSANETAPSVAEQEMRTDT
ncbi:hypothetical protein ACEQ6A_36075, partial [Rhizobium brockwellii]